MQLSGPAAAAAPLGAPTLGAAAWRGTALCHAPGTLPKPRAGADGRRHHAAISVKKRSRPVNKRLFAMNFFLHNCQSFVP